MRFQLTCFDFFNDGQVTTSFTVEAPSQEVGEYLIKKQLSKLFRQFPAGQLIFAPIQENAQGNVWSQLGGLGGSPVYVPNVGPNWTPNFVVGDQVITTGGLPCQWHGGMNVSGNVSVLPGDTVVINAVGEGTNCTYTVTNSSAAPLSFGPPQQ